MDSFHIRHLEKDVLFAAFTVIVIFIMLERTYFQKIRKDRSNSGSIQFVKEEDGCK